MTCFLHREIKSNQIKSDETMEEAGVWIQQGFADASGLAPGTQATLASRAHPSAPCSGGRQSPSVRGEEP